MSLLTYLSGYEGTINDKTMSWLRTWSPWMPNGTMEDLWMAFLQGYQGSLNDRMLAWARATSGLPGSSLNDALLGLPDGGAQYGGASLGLYFGEDKYESGAVGAKPTSKPFGDIITFTRASGGGRFNSSGVYEYVGNNVPRLDYDPVTLAPRGLLIEEQRTNLLTYSEQFDNAAWGKARATVKANSIVSPRGDVTGSKVTGNATGTGFLLSRNSIAAAGASQTQSFYLKRGSLDFACLVIGDNALANAARQWFNLNTGALGSSNSGGSGFSVTSAEVTNVGGGWFRCSVTVTGTGGTYAAIVYPAVSSNLGFGFTVGDYGYIWGAQLEAGAFPTSYIPTPATFTSRASTATYFNSSGVLTTAAVNEARYDHRFIGGQWVPTGLLLEEQRTRLNTVSTGATLLTPTRATYVTDGTLFVDGVTPFRKLVEDTSTNSHFGLPAVVSVLANTTYTAQYVVKAAGRTKFRLAAENTGNWAVSNPIVNYDLVAKTATGSGGATGTVKELGSGNYLVTWTATTGAAGFITYIYPILLNNAGNVSYTGDGVSGIYISGYQFEAGAFATSLIVGEGSQVTRAADVSSSAQVTRSADVASVNTLSPWYNAGAGTLVVQSSNRQRAPGGTFGLSIGQDSSNYIGMLYTSAAASDTVFVSVSGASASINSPTPRAKSALAWDGATFTLVSDGVVRGSMAKAIPPASTMLIGRGHFGGAVAGGHIQRIEYYPRRLSNTELQEITA